MTLRELALKLKKIYNFDVLTCEKWDNNSKLIKLYRRYNKNSLLPEYNMDRFRLYEWFLIIGEQVYVAKIEVRENTLKEELDLSEYEDDNGNVDYSKCIIEVD